MVDGQLHILQWAKEKGYPWTSACCANAARRGHLDVLKWLKEQGCPWDEWTCVCAAEGGHLDALKWLREQGCPWNREFLIKRAMFHQQNDIVKWIESN